VGWQRNFPLVEATTAYHWVFHKTFEHDFACRFFDD
jgi:hypothetical protein